VKLAAILFSAAVLLAQQKPPDQPHEQGEEHQGNFTIRFEPKAVLQTNAPIPFEIHVFDDLHKPLSEAKVTLQIETAEHANVQVFNAPSVAAGVYLAKPTFSQSGQWDVYVEVHRGNEMSARTIQYYVPEGQR
jgi:nitrogen fixation protein FixH